MALVVRRSGKRRRLMADINVVPYVDVMLVLVVILMVAAPFVNPGVVELPTVAKAGQQKELPVRVVVRSDGRISLFDGGVETGVQKGELLARCDSVRGRSQDSGGIEAIQRSNIAQWSA
jgi:biopolymer transport protein TolR